MTDTVLKATSLFVEAYPAWLEMKSLHIAPTTLNDYRYYRKALSSFFGKLRLDEIHIGHIRSYQTARRQCVKAGKVNQEISVLKQILREAGVWAPIAPCYHPLPAGKPEVGVALSESEEERLFYMASSQPRWRVAYCCALITANTTAGAGELLSLRIADVDVGQRTLYIREGNKNAGRRREVPLNDVALRAVEWLLQRVRAHGAGKPDDYLFPKRRAEGGLDFTKHMTSFWKTWKALREAAGLPHLRYYDLRHHAITKLAECPDVSEETKLDIAGHRLRATFKRYSHIRRDARQKAVDRLAPASSLIRL